MTLYMNIKQLGKRKDTVHKVPFEYEKTPGTLRELITETVKICVAQYISRMDRGDAVLTDEQIDDMSHIGKIAFGIVYGEKKPDVDEAGETAGQGFEDGLFRVFRGMDELTELDREEKFNDGD